MVTVTQDCQGLGGRFFDMLFIKKYPPLDNSEIEVNIMLKRGYEMALYRIPSCLPFFLKFERY